MNILHGLAICRTTVAANLVAVVAGFAGVLDAVAAANQCRMNAAAVGIAAIGGASIAIIAVEGRTADAGAGGAGVAGGAGIAVVTRGAVVGIDTTGLRVAAIIGANVAVVAVGRRAADALATGADIEGGASIGVVAFHRVVDELATDPGDAGIIGAQVVIVAGQCFTAKTGSSGALVVDGTDFTVIARGGIECVNAPGLRVAGVGGTDVIVITVRWCTADALSAGTNVARGALVAVFAGCDIGVVNAANLGVTRIISAGIPVVAIEGTGGATDAAVTNIPGGANIAVVALLGVVVVDTAGFGSAGVVGTDVTIIAIELPGTDALATRTGVFGSTGIAVVASHRVGRVEAA